MKQFYKVNDAFWRDFIKQTNLVYNDQLNLDNCQYFIEKASVHNFELDIFNKKTGKYQLKHAIDIVKKINTDLTEKFLEYIGEGSCDWNWEFHIDIDKESNILFATSIINFVKKEG